MPAPLSPVYPIGSAVSDDGHLELGGCDALALAREFGTPCYVVVADDLRERARAYLEQLHAHCADGEVLFASKAFPCTAVYRLFAAAGLGCDVASGGELALALRGGFDPARIYLHGNAKSREELSCALRAGVGQIVLDSRDDILRTETLAGELGRTQSVLIRVTPGVAGHTHAAISTGQADSKFGLALAEAPAAIAQVRACEHLELRGLHCHIGSQLFDLHPFEQAIQALASLGAFEVYDLGGGLGAAYLEAQRPPSIAEYVTTVATAARAAFGTGPRLVLEPGRSLVASSTVTLYTVQSVKRNVSTWVAVDGGMSDNLRPMLYGARYEAQIASRMVTAVASGPPPQTGGLEVCQLVGKHCESGDVIVRDAALPSPRVGDVVVTPATGAYGHAMANNYNGVPRPPVIFCSGGDARVVVRRETYADLASRDV